MTDGQPLGLDPEGSEQEERCPTCGSDDPRYARLPSGDAAIGEARCSDPFHSPQLLEEWGLDRLGLYVNDDEVGLTGHPSGRYVTYEQAASLLASERARAEERGDWNATMLKKANAALAAAAAESARLREALDQLAPRGTAAPWVLCPVCYFAIPAADHNDDTPHLEPWTRAECPNLALVELVPSSGLLHDVEAELARLERVHPSGYPTTRDGVRLGLAAAEDELEEAKLAWREGRCKCPTPQCDHADWSKTRAEIVQTIAVLLRTAEGMNRSEPERRRQAAVDARLQAWGR